MVPTGPGISGIWDSSVSPLTTRALPLQPASQPIAPAYVFSVPDEGGMGKRDKPSTSLTAQGARPSMSRGPPQTELVRAVTPHAQATGKDRPRTSLEGRTRLWWRSLPMPPPLSTYAPAVSSPRRPIRIQGGSSRAALLSMSA